MHLALKAYQELLATVNEMDMSPDEAVRESSRIIKSEGQAWTLIPAFPISWLESHSLFKSQLRLLFQALSFLVPTHRQHFLYDGVPRTISGTISKV